MKKLWISLGVLLFAAELPALEPNQVLVVVNANSSASVEIGEYYARRRKIPRENICRIRAKVRQMISWDEFLQQVRRPIERHITARGLKERILCLVTTYDVPYRIAPAADRETRAAVDSELSLLFHPPYGRSGSRPNPYFVRHHPAAKPFDRSFGIYLTARLEAPTPALTKGLVDKALEAEAKGVAGRGYFDARGLRTRVSYGMGDVSVRGAWRAVSAAGFATTLENTERLFQKGECPDTLFYYGWYRLGRYLDAFGGKFPVGAVCAHIASAEAIVLRRGRQWCKRFLEDGVTATFGPTGEPYLTAFPRGEHFFRHLFLGYTFVEAFFRAKPFISWQMVALGDPLYAPFKERPPALLEVKNVLVADGRNHVAEPGETFRLRLKLENAPTGYGPIRGLRFRITAARSKDITILDDREFAIPVLAPGEMMTEDGPRIRLSKRVRRLTELPLFFEAKDEAGHRWKVPFSLTVGAARRTDSSWPERGPVVSRDGSRFAYSIEGEVWVQRLDSLISRRVCTLPRGRGAGGLVWSKDGRSLLVFHGPRPGGSLTWCDLATGRPREVLTGVPLQGLEFFDTNTVYYRTPAGAFRYRLDSGKTDTVFTPPQNVIFFPNPSYDRFILVASRAGRQSFLIVDRAGRILGNVEAGTMRPVQTSWSQEAHVFACSDGRERVMVLDAGEGKLLAELRPAVRPSVSPDGKHVLYQTLMRRWTRTDLSGKREVIAEERLARRRQPDGRWYAPDGKTFLATEGGRWQVHRPDATRPPGPGGEDGFLQVAWSPDGKKILAVRRGGSWPERRAGPPAGRHVVLDPETGAVKDVFPGLAVRTVRWLSATQLSFVADGALWVGQVETGTKRKLISLDPGDWAVASPDERHILKKFSSKATSRQGQVDVALLDRQGKQLCRVRRAGRRVEAAWSWDGQRFFLAEPWAGEVRVYELAKVLAWQREKSKGEAPGQPVFGGGWPATWTSDGRLILSLEELQVRRYRLPSGPDVRVGLGPAFHLQWWSDGRGFGYVRRAGRNAEIWTFPLGRGSTRVLGVPGAFLRIIGRVAWGSDGRFALFTSDREGDPDIWLVPGR